MNLFIDTNILLSFYHYTSDELEELKKLIVLIEQGKVQLFVPAHVITEFKRNREQKIADALKKLKEQRLNLQYPQICKDYPEYEELRTLNRSYEERHVALMNKLAADIESFSLKADHITSQLFALAQKVACGVPVVMLARTRRDIGNPPGKKESLGDAINWEALLQAVPTADDLHFISDDRDFCSPLDEELFSGFLINEWVERKKSGLVFYKRISAFFKQHFPDIEFAAELEKALLIEDLSNSSSFARTHSVVARLAQYQNFDVDQINAIVDAATRNNQVSLIIGDSDVKAFISGVIRGKEKQINPDSLAVLTAFMSPPARPPVPDDDIPF